jgi:hypothetical protein
MQLELPLALPKRNSGVSDMFDVLHHPVRAGFDILAAVVTLGSLFNYLPTISALVGITWYIVCLYEYYKGKRRK